MCLGAQYRAPYPSELEDKIQQLRLDLLFVIMRASCLEIRYHVMVEIGFTAEPCIAT